MDWTTEQILGLAPDQFTLRAGRGLANPKKWIALHQADDIIWGIHPNGRSKTGETAVYLPTFTTRCTCKSRKSPCRHSLALLQLWQQQAHKFTSHSKSKTISAWIQREKMGQYASIGPQAQDLAQLKAGLHALELWLLDMVRHGLARLPERPKTYWDTMAHRLVDAQAVLLAQTVRKIAQIPKKQPNWPEQLLQEVGRLFLIVQGFRNFDQLPLTTQTDLQTAVGWLPTFLPTATHQTDHWLVLGRQQIDVGNHVRHLTWLWGQQTKTIAQLIVQTRQQQPEGIWLPTNTNWLGTLKFAPSNWPQIASRHGQLQESTAAAVPPRGFATVREAAQAYTQALAANPWLVHFPILLNQVQPRLTEAGWRIEDGTGTWLPLPEKFSFGWQLMALAGGSPSLRLFGVWNGRFLQPLSINQNNQWLDIHIWQGVK
ncbi:SWIM zinc finger family protein [Candidatus Leptofilum sp.]|uniref:SWIM zinc finger family protein n=1 Tax=Candidatus Leptofilum sp. TaxID=3241576 RepID=UPI003B5C779E